ncbi:MAG: GTP-binding protein [Acidobacteriota bacterium]
MRQARYVMIGGFLGAGKSTAVGRLARRLTDRGLRVGLITNDQGRGLVDTQTLRHQGFRVEEIAGGCFCCRFDSLKTAADRLEASERPDVFIAEPVGSCTDLVATVSYPLRRLYGDAFEIAPLSVLVDPVRCARVLGLDSSRKLSSKVTYVYEKQLEEAHALVINKTDLLDDTQLVALRDALETRFPGRPIFAVQARNEIGLDAWFDHLESTSIPSHPALEIDYALYGEGEARLGWLNATLRFEARREIDGNAWSEDVALRIQRALDQSGSEVAHLKMTLAPTGDEAETMPGDLALINLVGSDFVPELAERLAAPLTQGQLVVNLRAEATPATLRATLETIVASTDELTLEHVECFEPGQPVPTHRIDAHNQDLGSTI